MHDTSISHQTPENMLPVFFHIKHLKDPRRLINGKIRENRYRCELKENFEPDDDQITSKTNKKAITVQMN